MIDTVRQRMEDVATSLVRSGAARSFEIGDDDGLRLRIYGAVDGVTASAAMTATTEVYFLNLGDVYKTAWTAYDDDYKLEVLDDFLDSVQVFIEGNYYEEIGERKGRVVSRRMYIDGPGETYSISASLGVRAAIGRLLGYQKSVVRPPGR
jgi:hypothetical protein